MGGERGREEEGRGVEGGKEARGRDRRCVRVYVCEGGREGGVKVAGRVFSHH